MEALEEQINRGIQILRDGGVIAFPTDTVYGLGADAFNSEAVERIYNIKKRPKDLPLPVLIGDIKQLAVLVESVSKMALVLAERFWPGGLTIVLPGDGGLPAYLGSISVAVRLPSHPVCLSLVQAVNSPIIGTSANISGSPSVMTAGEVEQQLGSEVDLIIDGGKCPGGIESTVVDVCGERPVLVRPGIISWDKISRAVDESGLLYRNFPSPD